jgi:carbon monoxide dehydrogenase subunit G
MEMTGEQIIPVSQQTTWDALNDLEMLKSCIPGCESLVASAENQFDVVLTAKVGPVSAKFKGKLILAQLDPPNGYNLAFEGQGGVAGFAKGGAEVRLTPEGTGTKLSYSAKANVGGKLAQIGSRLIDGTAKKLADQFFTSFKKNVTSAG